MTDTHDALSKCLIDAQTSPFYMTLWQHLSEQISLHTHQSFKINAYTSVGGGSINEAYRVSNGHTHYFIKRGHINQLNMFKNEALALEEMQQLATIRVPRPICFGEHTQHTYIVMEYLNLSGHIDSIALGQQLATMHKISAKQFGWRQDNTIGSTPQQNQLTPLWLDFWREQRMAPQLVLAKKNGYGHALNTITDKLLPNMQCLFENHNPTPSMLHGDLWGGNAAALADGTPVIFDPAFYYGDRETDIAMTRLFGGFDSHFYAAYHEAWPLNDGFKVRQDFYNLYHVLNHLNLFGDGYLKQTIHLTERVLANI